jgi:hypothetical protein
MNYLRCVINKSKLTRRRTYLSFLFLATTLFRFSPASMVPTTIQRPNSCSNNSPSNWRRPEWQLAGADTPKYGRGILGLPHAQIKELLR